MAKGLGGQIRAIPGVVLGFDMTAALALGAARGIPAIAVAELLPIIEQSAVRAMNAQTDAGGNGVSDSG